MYITGIPNINITMKKPAKKYTGVMLIDDSEIDNFINSKMMEACNFAEHVYIHTSSKSALEFLKNIEKTGESANNLLPQVIFLDINMPIMDGLQFLAEFAKLKKRIISSCQVYMLTASQNPDDIEQAQKNHYVKRIIQKPLSESILKEL